MHKGLGEYVVPHERVLEYSLELAKKIASRGPLAIKLAKTAINRGLDSSFVTAGYYEAEIFAECFASGQAREGMDAFLEKRKPNWK